MKEKLNESYNPFEKLKSCSQKIDLVLRKLIKSCFQKIESNPTVFTSENNLYNVPTPIMEQL